MTTDGPATETMEAALARLRTVVGDQHVLTSSDDIEANCRDISLWRRTCSAVVYPGTAAEVADVMRVAAELELPVWPFSKGKNWGYGARMALEDGAIVLMLERLDRIIEVNEELAYAVIEPGVSQGQLNAYLRTNGFKLWTDCTDSTPEGSVIGNSLERGLGYTPYWDHFGNLCGLEVVLADGETIRTGGGPEASLSWNTHKWGSGPYLEGLFSQSNFGIVTKAGVWLMPEPTAFNSFICEVDDERHQAAVVDAIRHLASHRLIEANVHMVNDVLTLAQLAQYPWELVGDETRMSDQVRSELRGRYRVPRWAVTGGLYGSAGQVRVSRQAVKKALTPFGRVTFLNDRKLRAISGVAKAWRALEPYPSVTGLLGRLSHASVEKLELLPHVYTNLKGVPDEFIVRFAYFKSRRPRPTHDVDPARDGVGMTWMAVTSPMTGRHTRELLALVDPIFRRHGLDMALSLIMVNPRTMLALFEIFYDRDNIDEHPRLQALHDELAEETLRAGYQQYRTSVGYSPHILDTSPGVRDMLNAMKAAVDPHNIIAPGRYGIG